MTSRRGASISALIFTPQPTQLVTQSAVQIGAHVAHPPRWPTHDICALLCSHIHATTPIYQRKTKQRVQKKKINEKGETCHVEFT